MLIHSCLYYELDESIVSDHQWQAWAEELTVLQKEHPEFLKINFFDWDFRDWDGITGAHLRHREPWVYKKALNILEYHNGHKEKTN